MPERSNLFESHWSNQWLTQNRVKGKETAETPDWVTETPELNSGYSLMMEDQSIWEQDIQLTRTEYIALKAHLAKLRGYVSVAPSDT
jgi:hypothetical protein